MARGKFISFEGGEGAGKSTQARLLKIALEAQGRSVVLTREPGGSPGAEQIRKLLVEGAPDRWTPMSELLLFMAARADHVARLIEPGLAAGNWVISDRFSDSSFVYQGIARGVGTETVRILNDLAVAGCHPDLTIILDIDPAFGLTRAAGRGLALFDPDASARAEAEPALLHEATESRFERFDRAFHDRLRSAFREIAERDPGRVVLVDGARASDDIAADIRRIVEDRLQP